MKVVELAKRLAITPDTVRFYTRKNFLIPNKNLQNGYKQYGEAEVKRLRFILSARQLGFSVKDIAQILHQADHGDSACPLVRDLIEQRLEQTKTQFEQTKALREKMELAIEQWQVLPDMAPSKEMICHLIETFTQASNTTVTA